MGASETATSADAVRTFREAERRFLALHGITARERWVSLARPSAIRLRLLEIGEGPPVLHVHGGGVFGALHAPLAAALPGRRHILFDRPGFGLSERADLGPDFRARSVALLGALLDALELERVDVVGNSIGAGMAFWLALAEPHRVRSLALAGAAAMMGHRAPLPLRLLGTPVIGALLLALDAPSERQVRSFLARFGHPPDAVDPALRELILAAERLPEHARAWRELIGATLSWSGEREGLPLTPAELARLSCPVAFAWGASDPTISAEEGRAAARAIPGARFAVAGVGHAPWLDDARAVAAALEPVLAPSGERARPTPEA